MLFLPALLSKKCWWSSVEVESSVKYCRYYCCCCCCHCGRWLVAFYCCRECCCCNLFFFTFNAGIELDNEQHTVDVCCAMKRPIYKIEPSTSTARSKSMENNYVRPSVLRCSNTECLTTHWKWWCTVHCSFTHYKTLSTWMQFQTSLS